MPMHLCMCYIRYAPRWDCGCQYEITVELLNQRKKPIQTFNPEIITFPQWNEQQWNQVCKLNKALRRRSLGTNLNPHLFFFQMTHVFKNYGRGVRYVRFTHGGKDTQFWTGWYGIRVTNSCVEICPAVEPELS